MVAQRGEETVLLRPTAIPAEIGKDIRLIELADVLIDCICCAVRVIVVPDGDDEIDLPAIHQLGDICFGLPTAAEITDDGEADCRERRCGGGWRGRV